MATTQSLADDQTKRPRKPFGVKRHANAEMPEDLYKRARAITKHVDAPAREPRFSASGNWPARPRMRFSHVGPAERDPERQVNNAATAQDHK